MENKSLSQRIADFVLGLKYEDIPKEVIDHAKMLMIDTFGVSFPSMDEDHAKQVKTAVLKLTNVDQATLWGENNKTTLDHALMYNGCLVHGLDYDDTHAGAIIHPSSSVVTTAVSLGEYLKIDGKQLITSMVAAYEVLLRLGNARNELSRTF